MALSTKTLESTSAAANNTSRVAATITLPSNCHTVIIYNEDSTNTIYVAEGTASGVVLPKASSSHVPPGGSLSLSIGTKTARVSGINCDLVYSTSAGTIAVNISYLCTNIL